MDSLTKFLKNKLENDKIFMAMIYCYTAILVALIFWTSVNVQVENDKLNLKKIENICLKVERN